MKYKKKENETLDRAYNESKKYGFYIRFSKEALFYRKGLHWEYVEPQNIIRMHRRVEEVVSHTSCCAENMDIQRLIIQLNSGETVSIHVCDGEPRMAENLYEEIKNTWTEIEYGTITK